MTSSALVPATAPGAPRAPGPEAAIPCPCGRAHPLIECCLPVAQRLRRGPGDRPSPFDEIRATSSLLLWGLLAREQPSAPTISSLSHAAHRFWGTVLAASLGNIRDATLLDPAGATGTSDAEYGRRLFERTWGATAAETRTWMLGALPSFVRGEPLLGELALDWLLWDQPWLHCKPGAYWTARSGPLTGRPRVRRTYEAILRSRVGLWRLKEAVPQRGFRLVDRLTGDRTWLHTPSDPWPDTDERLLLARVYTFGTWHLLAGRCLLLDPTAVDDLLTTLHSRATATGAPQPHDPRWRGWLKAELVPVVAAQWVAARLAPPPADRYHGTYC
jgi:hypothetical protein